MNRFKFLTLFLLLLVPLSIAVMPTTTAYADYNPSADDGPDDDDDDDDGCDGDPCCDSDDECCGSDDECCGNDDPCCENPESLDCQCENASSDEEKCELGCPGYEDGEPPCCEECGGGTNSLKYLFTAGRFRVDGALHSCVLSLYAKSQPGPSVYKPGFLVLRGVTGMLVFNADTDLINGNGGKIQFLNGQQKLKTFRFEAGASEGFPEGNFTSSKEIMHMVDISGNPVVSSPVYFDLTNARGEILRFDVESGQLLSIKSPTGKTLDLTSPGMDLDIVRTEGFTVRQIKSGSGLVDIVSVDPFKYEIRYYAPGQAGSKVDGLYQPVGSPYRKFVIENPLQDADNFNTLHITNVYGNRSATTQFQYTESLNQWEMREAFGTPLEMGERIYTTYNGNKTLETRTFEKFGSADYIQEKKVSILEEKPWGQALVMTRDDPDGDNITTEYEYYEDESDTGSYSRKKSMRKSNGSWETYQYDAEGRLAKQVESYLDAPFGTPEAQVKVIEFDYSPVDPRDGNDPLLENIVRKKTTKILGRTTAVFYQATFSNQDGEVVQIMERAHSPSAAYGDPANDRSETVYYASTESPVRAGKPRLRISGDGTSILYDYSLDAGSNLVLTETHGTASSPSGIAYKTNRTVTTKNNYGSISKREIYLYTGSGYELIRTRESLYDTRGLLIQSKEDGRVTMESTYTDGLPTSVVSGDGSVTTTTYDILERRITQTRVGLPGQGISDITTSYNYDGTDSGCGCSASNVTVSAGGLSYTTETQKDRLGRTRKQTAANGFITTTTFTNNGLTKTIVNPDSAILTRQMFMDGKLKSLSHTGRVTQYHTYGINSDGTRWTRIDYGSPVSLRYEITTKDMLGRVVKIEKPGFGGSILTTQHTYNDLGQLVSTTATGQPAAAHTYDELGNRISTTLDGGADGTRTTGSDSLYVQQGGAWWRQTTSTLNSITTSTSLTRISGFTEHASYGLLTAETIRTDIYGNVSTSTSYTDRDSQKTTSITQLPGATAPSTSIAYQGLTMEMIAPGLSSPVTYTYDGLRRRTSTKDPRHQNPSTTVYYTQDDEGTEGYLLGAVKSQTDAAGHTTSYQYTPSGEPGAGQISAITNPAGKTSYLTYDTLGNRTRVWGATDYPVQYTYDTFGQLASLSTHRGGSGWDQPAWPEGTAGTPDTTTWTYDEATGLLLSKTYADGHGPSYTYTSEGRLLTRTWARTDGGNPLSTTYTYNSFGQLTHTDYSDPGTPDITTTYDILGHRSSITDAAGTRTFAYDPATLQLQSETLSGSGGAYGFDRTLTYAYDAIGRGAGYDLTDGTSTLTASAYGYDSATGRLTTVADTLHNHTATYSYTANSSLLSGYSIADSSTTHLTTSYSYEPNRDLKTVVENQGQGGALLSKFQYPYDQLGRRSAIIKTGQAFTTANHLNVSYNDRSEVIAAAGFEGTDLQNPGTAIAGQDYAYTFDNIGNRTQSVSPVEALGTPLSRTYTSNNLNQYTETTAGSDTWDNLHDDDGNLIQSPDTTGKLIRYSWNGENRLIATQPAVPQAGDKRLEFTYDHQGRRIAKKTLHYDGSEWELEEVRKFVYNEWSMVEEVIEDGVGTVANTKTYQWGLDLAGSLTATGNVGALLSCTDTSASDTYFYTYDANGNVSTLTDTTGTLAAAYDYSPFGNLIAKTGTYSDNNRFQFSAKYQDAITNLLYYGYRYYDSTKGRWINKDPIGEKGYYLLFGEEYNESNVEDAFRSFKAPLQEEVLKYSFIKNQVLNFYDVLGLRGGSSGGRSACLNKGDPWEWVSNGNTPSTNGCTGAPDSFGVANFTPACNAHDICYGTCSEEKGSCDNAFYNDLIAACDAAEFVSHGRYGAGRLRSSCHRIASHYYAAVVAFGGSFYNSAQKANCECKCNKSD